MVSYANADAKSTGGIDRVKLRLAVLGVLVIAAFVALFSRLWFLQVLASEEYERFARENRVRFVYSEPARGRILDRDGRVLVRNRRSLSVTIDKQIVDEPSERRKTLRRVSRLLEVPVQDLRRRLNDVTVSPYKPVAVANDISEEDAIYIKLHHDRFPGVGTESLPVRHYPHGALAAHILGYVGEISPEELEDPHFQKVRPAYGPGDLVGKEGVEYHYDRFLRGKPEIDRVIVNSVHDVVGSHRQQNEEPGNDLVLSIDLDVQRHVERALKAGLEAARPTYQAPAGGVVVMDPRDGAVIAIASHPDYDPSILADGITTKEFAALGGRTATGDDDALLNRVIGAVRKPGSTFKVVTGGAAMATDVATPYTVLECPGAKVYPPSGGSGSVTFHNWTSAHKGAIGFPASLEHSCNTFYYELGWRMEARYGVSVGGDGSERFQRYARRAGLGHPTGIDLRYERTGLVPDEEWCKAQYEATKSTPYPTCAYGWLPGFTVNISIGQGDLLVTPLQMAVTYGAIANGGKVMKPRLGWELATPVGDESETVRSFKRKVAARLPLDATELGVIQEGLWKVLTGSSGTARGTFAGFPLNRYPIAGKTGTAQLVSGDTKLNDAWFVSYAPKDDPEYVMAVYVEKAGHGGTSAAPIAREIWEAIFGIDTKTDVRLGTDFSG